MNTTNFLIFAVVVLAVSGGIFYAFAKQSEQIAEIADLKERQIKAQEAEAKQFNLWDWIGI